MEKSLLQNLSQIVRRHKGDFFLSVLLFFFSNALLISNPLILRVAIEDKATNPFLWAALLILIALTASFLRYQTRMVFNKVSREVEKNTRSLIFEKIQSQSMEFFNRYGVGELIERLSNDMNTYRDVLGPGLVFPTYFLTMLIPGLAALFWISPIMGLFSLIPVVCIPGLNVLARRDLYQAAKGVQMKLAEMSDFVQEDYSSVRIVKSYLAERDMYRRFSLFCDEFFQLNFRFMCLQGWFYPLFILATRFVTILLVLVAGILILPPSDFVSFMWIQAYILYPLIILGWVIPIWQQGRAAYDRLREIYEEPNCVQGGTGDLKIPPLADIVFRHLTFSYPGLPPILHDINLTIKGGELVGLTGPSGAGKSTIFRLLNREFEVPHGMIEIGGRDIHDYPLSAFNEIVSVDQTPFLFSKSIWENVGFAKKEATEEDIYRASTLADLHETVKEFDLGYDTLVGEKGVMLSGGQKARVTMARAFLVDRSILLLDDIFASVDNQTALRIFQALKENYSGRTLILMTSKANILEKMDRVIFLVKGRVVEDGTPQELLQKKGRFFALKELENA